MGAVLDLHCHTVYGSPDSELTAEQLVETALETGLTACCVTEHDKMWQQWLATLVKQGWIMQTQFGWYARPRSSADRALAYHRRRRPEPGITLARQLRAANQKILKEMSCVSYRGVINNTHE